MAILRQWFLILFALALGGGQVLAASSRETRAYAAAVLAFHDEMWSVAETDFNQFVESYPNSTNAPMAALLAAQSQIKQNHFSDAVKLLHDRSLLAGNLADQYDSWLAEAQFQNGDFARAAETWTVLAKKYPGSPLRLSAVVKAAAAYARLPDWPQHDALLEDTNGVFQHAAQLDPGNKLVVAGRLSLENSKYQQHDFPGVAAVYELLAGQWQTLTQEQQCQAAYLLYLAKNDAGDFAAALAAATNLVQIARSPTNQDWLATAWASQGAELKSLGRTNEALAAYQQNLAPGVPQKKQQAAILEIAVLAVAQDDLTNAEAALETFLGQFANSPGVELARLTLGELHLKDFIAHPADTNHLAAAQFQFDQLLAAATNGPLAGKAFLDRGWCFWLAKKYPESFTSFESAVSNLPFSIDLAVAKFKAGDARFKQNDFVGARADYQSVLDDFTNFPAVGPALGEQALYQNLRANLELNDASGAKETLARILKTYPEGNLSGNAILLDAESVDDSSQTNGAADARALLEQFEKRFPNSELLPQARLAVARTYEQEPNWPAAITNYAGWLRDFPTNSLRPQAEYALALAHYQADDETDALAEFTAFISQYPANEALAPLAQWWVADYFFRTGNWTGAETNYEAVFQNPAWKNSPLIYPAQLMAGRAAMARQGFPDANRYFASLISDSTSDTNFPPGLAVQAKFAYAVSLRQTPSTDTNNPLANFQTATNILSQILTSCPTNEAAMRAWGEIGDCDLLLNDLAAATNAYAQVFSTDSSADISTRSAAQIAFGMTLEKMAALPGSVDRTNLLNQVLDNYLNVFRKTNLRDGEMSDEWWVKEAGVRAAPLVGLLNNSDSESKFYGDLKTALPELADFCDKKIAALAAGKN